MPFAVAAILLLQRTLKLPTVPRDVKVDYLGAFLIMAGVSTLLVWSSLAGHQFAWGSWQTAVLVTTGLVVLAPAVLVEAKVREPILPLGLFRNRTITLTTVAGFPVGVAMFGGTVFLSQYFQLALGKSPTVAGLMSLPMIFGLLVSSTVSGQLISRTGKGKAHLVLGAILLAAGLGLLGTIDAHTSVVMLGLFVLVLGVGVGMLVQNLVLVAQNDVPAHDLGAVVLPQPRRLDRGERARCGARRPRDRVDHRGPRPAAGRLGHGAEPGDAAGAGREGDPRGLRHGDLFLIAAPIALLVVVAVAFLEHLPFKMESGLERLADEEPAVR